MTGGIISTLFLVAALVCFALQALRVSGGRVDLLAAGLTCLAASMLLTRV